MHISDSVLSPSVWIGGYAIAGAAVGGTLRWFDERRIPQVAVMSSVFFVASSITLPLGAGSLHLLLNGLLGVVLGRDAVPAIFLSLLLQALLLGHGGLTALGVNTLVMAGGALAGQYSFRLRGLFRPRAALDAAFGLLAGAVGVAASAVLFASALYLSDPGYLKPTLVYLMALLPLVPIEAAVTASAVSFLMKVDPELIAGIENAPRKGPGGEQ